MSADLLLDVWVVYDHPRDLPDFYVVRRQSAASDGSIVHDTRAYGFRDLGKARAWLEQQGLTRLSRSDHDDPAIVEVWL